jgi:hypothetical protein
MRDDEIRLAVPRFVARRLRQPGDSCIDREWLDELLLESPVHTLLRRGRAAHTAATLGGKVAARSAWILVML